MTPQKRRRRVTAKTRNLRSKHWQDFRATYFATRPSECVICGGSAVHLHHKTYDRMGEELEEDVVAVCNSHHRKIHRYHSRHGRRRGMSLAESTDSYIETAKK